MKSLNNIINEKLVINKHSKIKLRLVFNLEEFKILIKNELDYELTDIDFLTLKDQYLESNQSLNYCKFIDITNDDYEWNYYVSRVAKQDNMTLNKYYIMHKLNKGIIFAYNQVDVDHSIDNGYRIGYVLDNIENRKNKDMVKIFKVKA